MSEDKKVQRFSVTSNNDFLASFERGEYVLFAEYEKLKAENTKQEMQISGLIKHGVIQHKTITKLTLQRDIMKKALEFYSDQKQMNHGIEITCDETGFVNDGDFEHIGQIEPNEYREREYYVYGKTARKALSEVENAESN